MPQLAPMNWMLVLTLLMMLMMMMKSTMWWNYSYHFPKLNY
uniref:ATP synthase F0 subunit 8 n=1 Tax=Endomyzostoma sp. MZ-2009 TaxID=644517 RepID=C7BG51_9ANNE|nr:ATP synthase F0 subunit 8 [Endomyzostoma sp. MZ-2009]